MIKLSLKRKFVKITTKAIWKVYSFNWAVLIFIIHN